MPYLVISFVMMGLVHGWLILSHRGRNPATLSYHSIRNSRTLCVYAVSHLIAAALLVCFVVTIFGTESRPLLIAAGVAAATECLQALLPARGKTDYMHTVTAAIMALALVLVGLLATLHSSPPPPILSFNLAVTALLLAMAVAFIRYPPRKSLWKLQYLGQMLLYLQIFLVTWVRD